MAKPLLSVCTITYNHAPYIRDCIEGVLMQKTDFAIEHLIHDDASTDGTEEIIREYEAKYPDIIKPLYEKENQWVKGRRGSRVFNYPRARGKYIAICEGDDYWTDPYKLQKQVDFLEANPEYGLVSTDILHIVDENRNILPDNSMLKAQRSLYKQDPTFFDLMGVNFINTLTVCARTDLMKETSYRVDRENLWFVYDYWFWMQIAIKSKIRVLKDKTACYRDHSGGISKSKGFYNTRKKYYLSYDLLMSYEELNGEDRVFTFRRACSLLIRMYGTLKMKIKLLSVVLKYYPGIKRLMKDFKEFIRKRRIRFQSSLCI